MGKKQGALIKRLKDVVASLTEEQVVLFEKEQKLELAVGEKEVVLRDEDLFIRTTASEGWSVAENKDALVAIDTKISNELFDEGVSREFVNRVQGLRRSCGLNVTDCVDVFVCGDSGFVKSISSNKEYVCEETLTKNLVFETEKRNISSLVEIGLFKVYILSLIHI